MTETKRKKKMTWGKRILIILAIVVAVLVLAFVLLMAFWRPLYVVLKANRFEKELKTAAPGQVVFAGDSITDFYDVAGSYPGYTIYNRGVSGDATFHLLERMDNIYQLQPSVVVLLIGVNDFLNEKRPVDDIVTDYEKILQGLSQHCPGAALICQSVYPTFADGEKSKIADRQKDISVLNGHIKRLAEQYGATYADVFSVLTDDTGEEADARYTKDGIHPNEEGYKVVTAYLTPYLEEAHAGIKG